MKPRRQCEILRFAVEPGCGRHDDDVLKRLSCVSMPTKYCFIVVIYFYLRVRGDDAVGHCEHVYWYRPVLHRHKPECDF